MGPTENESLRAALKLANDFASAILLKPLEQLGGILSDSIEHWRLRNQARLLLKTKCILEARGIDPAKILPDVFVPLIDDAGNVESEVISAMFAELLVSHLDPERQNSVHPSFSTVLAQLSPLDAATALQFRRYVSYEAARDVGLRGAALTVEMVATAEGVAVKAAYLSCLNLQRLGIIEHLGYRAPGDHMMPTLFEFSMEHQLYRMSEYGVALIEACGGENEP